MILLVGGSLPPVLRSQFGLSVGHSVLSITETNGIIKGDVKEDGKKKE